MTADRDHLCDDISMYALGGLSEKERKAFEEHLKQCPECQKDIVDMKELVESLPLAAQDAEPPAGMKSRILARVLQPTAEQSVVHKIESPSAGGARAASSPASTERETGAVDMLRRINKRRSRLAAALGAAAIVLLAATSVLGVRLSALNEDKSSLMAEVSKLQGELASGSAPVAGLQVHNVVALKPTVKDMVAQGTALIVIDSKGTHLIVQAEKLPELQGDEAFQVWLLKDGNPVNAGTFISRYGTGALYFTFPPDDYDTVAITQEPDANGTKPRGSIVLAAKIGSPDGNGA